MKEQLAHFMNTLSKTFFQGAPLLQPTSWKEAFHLLHTQIEKIPKSKKIIIFLDELPWLATKRSGLLQVLDHFWNAYWSRVPNLILIVCGSTASWMLDHLINAKGGLHNRLTKTLLLKPYNLKGAQEFLRHRGIKLKPMQILNLYMALGGIPHYLKQVTKGKSATQINEICFQKDGLLYGEFDRLFHSLFESSDAHINLVKVNWSDDLVQNEVILADLFKF